MVPIFYHDFHLPYHSVLTSIIEVNFVFCVSMKSKLTLCVIGIYTIIITNR